MAEEFPKIRHKQLKFRVDGYRNKRIKQLKTEVLGYYDKGRNEIVVNVSPCSFSAEYEFYGFRGLVRSLTATVIHELSHWATKSMSGHNGKATLRNTFRTRHFLQCDLWTLRIHSILYDLQKKDSCRTYF